jgi:bifunctional oligoribonuclease and PAP phosphatase NrnA
MITSFEFQHDQRAILQEALSRAQRIVVTTHKSPDGDAAGSSTALVGLLTAMGKNVQLIFPDTLPEFLTWMPRVDQALFYDSQTQEADAAIDAADLIFSLDYNRLNRVGPDLENKLRSKSTPFILIDHHEDPENFAVVTYSHTSACSTAELIFALAEQMEWTDLINPDIAASIYCGIMTDSGSFRFPSVTAAVHRLVAKLKDIGLDHALVHQAVYDANEVDRMRLVGYAISEKLMIIHGGQVAYISLTQTELQRFNYKPGDTESLVNQALSVRGVRLAAFFREGNDEIKISLRSKGALDVNQFAAKHFGGGGHKNAAGAQTKMNMEQLIAYFSTQVEEALNSLVQ